MRGASSAGRSEVLPGRHRCGEHEGVPGPRLVTEAPVGQDGPVTGTRDDRPGPLRTRLGLVLLLAGLAALTIAAPMVTSVVEPGSPTVFLPVALGLLVAFLPGRIRPGEGWARGRVATVPGVLLLVVATPVALLGLTFGVGGATAWAVAAALVVALLAVVAARLPAPRAERGGRPHDAR